MNYARYNSRRRNTLTLKGRILRCTENTLVCVLKPIVKTCYKNRKGIKLFFTDLAVIGMGCLFAYAMWCNVREHPRGTLVLSALAGGLAFEYIRTRGMEQED